MTYRSRHRTEGNLIRAGLAPVVEFLLGTHEGHYHFPCHTPQQAKRAQRLLYEWLWGEQEIKARTTLTVKDSTLTIKVGGKRERRGRKGGKR